MGFLDKPKIYRPLKEEFEEYNCLKCAERTKSKHAVFTRHKLEPCVGWFCTVCGNEY